MEEGNRVLEQALQRELEALSKDELRLDSDRQVIAARMETIRRRKDLIEALLATPGVDSTGTGQGQPMSPARGEKTAGNGRSVADIAYDILHARGKKTMHYEELAERVRADGGVLGGASPAQTLVSRIAKDPRFVRPEKRGWYAAREFYPKAKSVGARSTVTRHPKHGPTQ